MGIKRKYIPDIKIEELQIPINYKNKKFLLFLISFDYIKFCKT